MGEIVEVREGEPEILNLFSYQGVNYFKSVRRAIRRGHVTMGGLVDYKRPFNNRKRTKGRKLQVDKERTYGKIKSAQQV